ncbi:MAG: hypothetical protein LZF62_180033 [Nitrospira sp.]|nr:MAG: hypothetical protein LZF62_180033 [Nitrospira sp.]
MAGWIDRWRAATVVLGLVQETKVRSAAGRVTTKKFFAVAGTGVLFSPEGNRNRISWLVTAKHVFFDPGGSWRPSNLSMLFSRSPRKGKAREVKVPLQLRHAGRRCWFPHPNEAVDLAWLPLPANLRLPQSGSPSPITSRDLAHTVDLCEGVPVAVLGYPGAIDLPDSPRMIVRQGIVAWVSPTKPKSERFLIDSHVFPGNSGSPVFQFASVMDGQRPPFGKGTAALLGIVTQARIQSFPLLADGKQVELYLQEGKVSEPLLAPNFLGLGLVEPAYRIKQLLASALAVSQRRKRPGRARKSRD